MQRVHELVVDNVGDEPEISFTVLGRRWRTQIRLDPVNDS